MHKIIINNFGPVSQAEVNLDKRMQVFIGTQASGKSTICKIIYFCQKIRDYTLDFLMNKDQFIINHKNEYFNVYMKYLTKQFMGYFGKTTHMQRFKVKYVFAEHVITIALNRDGYIRFGFSSVLKEKIQALMLEASNVYLGKINNEILSLWDSISVVGQMKQTFYQELCELFRNNAEIIYIPAGRSLLATMSEQLHDLSLSEMDLAMQDFINLIRKTKSRFGTKIPEIVKDYTKTVTGQINNSAVEQAYNLIREIFKADYTSENDSEKIYFDDRHWVKLMYGSSGQQEVLWILMLCFIIILEGKRSFVIIEEPEAHLFPIAQKNVIDLISLMVNTTKSSVIITTHSPYILTSLNILLYSDKVENHVKSKTPIVIPKNLRINFNTFTAYKLCHNIDNTNTMESLLDDESHMIDTNYIDEVSTITNLKLEKLFDKEDYT